MRAWFYPAIHANYRSGYEKCNVVLAFPIAFCQNSGREAASFIVGKDQWMIWPILALLLIIGLVGLLTSSELVGGVIQIILICALVALGIRSILRSKAQ